MEEDVRRLLAEIDAKSKELNELLVNYYIVTDKSKTLEGSDKDEILWDIKWDLDELESDITLYQEFKGWI